LHTINPRQQLDKITVQTLTLPNATVPFSTAVIDFGVRLDSQLTMADHYTISSFDSLVVSTTTVGLTGML